MRQANLPHRQSSDSTPGGRSESPGNVKDISAPPEEQRSTSPNPVPMSAARTGRAASPSPVLRPHRALSPNSATFPNKRDRIYTPESEEVLEPEEQELTGDDQAQFSNHARPATPTFTGTSTNSGRTITGFPRTVRLSPSKTGENHTSSDLDATSLSPPKFMSATPGLSSSSVSARSFEKVNTPVKQTSTGTRYGAALGEATPSPVRQWGGVTPQCPRCGKSVYFAEQVGKIIFRRLYFH